MSARSRQQLRDKQFQILAKASPKSTRLFGAVTEADVADVIKSATGVEVDKRRISLIDPIKVTGVYELSARLHPEVTVPFSVEVVTPEQLEAREKARIAAEERAARDEARAAEEAAAAEAAAAERAARTEASADETAPAEPAHRRSAAERAAAREARQYLRAAPDAES